MKLRQIVLSLHKEFGETACQELRQLGNADVAKELAAAIQQLALGGQADAQALVTMVAGCPAALHCWSPASHRCFAL